MSWLGKTVDSSIGGKFIVAVTGLALVGFVIGHISGNLLIFAGPEAINSYAEGLRMFPALLWTLRIGLLAAAVAHIYFAIRLNIKSKAARPIPYVKKGYRRASFASRSMVLTGVLLLLYIVYHLADFTWRITNPEFAALGHYDVYQMLLISFKSPVNSILYILAMIVLGLHLSHGISSLFQTFGWNHPKYQRLLGGVGPVLGWGLALLYSSIPVAVLLGIVQ